jgi:hypothetical protein
MYLFKLVWNYELLIFIASATSASSRQHSHPLPITPASPGIPRLMQNGPIGMDNAECDDEEVFSPAPYVSFYEKTNRREAIN